MLFDLLLTSSVTSEGTSVVADSKTIPLSSFLAGIGALGSAPANHGIATQTEVGSIIASMGGFKIIPTGTSTPFSLVGRPGQNSSHDGGVFAGGASGSLVGSLWTLGIVAIELLIIIVVL
jgi:hypothetical protein